MSTSSPIALGPELTIPYAAQVRDQLFDALTAGGDMTLDLSGVSDFDSSGIQILLAARRSLVERGDALVLHAPSAAVRDALGVFGLRSTFDTHTA